MRYAYYTMLSSSCGIHLYDIGDGHIFISGTELDAERVSQDIVENRSAKGSKSKGTLSLLRTLLSFIRF